MIIPALASYTIPTNKDKVLGYGKKIYPGSINFTFDTNDQIASVFWHEETDKKKAIKTRSAYGPNMNRTKNAARFPFADKLSVTLNVSTKEKKSETNTPLAHTAYVTSIDSYRSLHPDNRKVAAIADWFLVPANITAFKNRFGLGGDPIKIENDFYVDVSIDGDRILETVEYKRWWEQLVREQKESPHGGICVSCGRVEKFAESSPQMVSKTLVPNASVPLAVASTNADTHTYSLNADHVIPVCLRCMDAAAVNLNHLLSDLNHRVRLPKQDSVLVWWSPDPAIDSILGSLTENRPTEEYEDEEEDDDEAAATAVADLVMLPSKPLDVEWNSNPRLGTTVVYSAVLRANMARISVYDMTVGTLSGFQETIDRWLSVSEIVSTTNRRSGAYYRHYSLYQLLRACGKPDFEEKRVIWSDPPKDSKKSDPHRPQTLGLDLAAAAYQGRKLNPRVARHVITRLTNDHYMCDERAALLRVHLNSTTHTPEEKEMTVGLDETNMNEDYVAGRIFAALEHTQEYAHSVKNQSGEVPGRISDKYFALLLRNPRGTVLGQARKNLPVWLKAIGQAKNGGVGQRSAEEAKINALFTLLDSTASTDARPTGIDRQARTALGYHHQKAYNHQQKLQNIEKKKYDEATKSAAEKETTAP